MILHLWSELRICNGLFKLRLGVYLSIVLVVCLSICLPVCSGCARTCYSCCCYYYYYYCYYYYYYYYCGRQTKIPQNPDPSWRVRRKTVA